MKSIRSLPATGILCIAFLTGLYAQTAPNPGEAAGFGLLSGGNITALDTVYVNGNAGAAGTITANIVSTGSVLAGNQAPVPQALTDLTSARQFCTAQGGIPKTNAQLYNATLGSGVYQISGNLSLNSTLTLTGDSASVFIFNVTGSMLMTGNARILLSGISFKNVFFNVNGNITAADNGEMNGVFMSGQTINAGIINTGTKTLLAQGNVNIKEGSGIFSILAAPCAPAFFTPLPPITGCGLDYTQVSISLHQRVSPPLGAGIPQPAPLNVTGISGNTVLTAFLWFVTVGSNPLSIPFTLTDPIGNTYNLTANRIASVTGDPSASCATCWPGYTRTTSAYRVTIPVNVFAPGNGTYILAGLPVSAVGPNADTDGATLLIVYQHPQCQPGNRQATLVLSEGLDVVTGGNGNNYFIPGLNVPNNPVNARGFLIAGDIESSTIQARINGMPQQTVMPPLFWNFIQQNTLLTPFQPSITYNLTSFSPDCFATAVLGVYYEDGDFTCESDLAANAGSDKLCYGQPPATVQIGQSATGGVPPYTYSWLPATGLSCTNCAQPSASPSTGTAYTVTVTDAAGCTATDAVTVSPVVIADAGADQASCAGSNVSIGGSPAASSGTPPYTYNWTPAAGLSCTNCPNPTASPAAATTYTLTVTDALGCTATDAVTVNVQNLPPACCQSPDITLSNTSVTGAGLPAVVSNQLVYITGTFTVDAGFTFTGCNVVMAPMARIDIVPGNTFTLTGVSHLYSCTQLWDGIYINGNTASLIVNAASTIEDAENAIVSVNGGIFDVGVFATLNKNYKHVVVQPYNQPHTGHIATAGLVCRSSATSPGATLKAPRTGQRTGIGVQVNDVQDIAVGDPLVPGNNFFENADIGIDVVNTDIVIRNNRFNTINSAIIARDNNFSQGNPATWNRFVAGGASISDSNVVSNGFNGIRVFDYPYVSITANRFSGLYGFGAYVNTLYTEEQLLNGNNIQNTGVGVYHYTQGIRFTGMPVALQVNNNLIINSGTYPGLFGGILQTIYGISLQEFAFCNSCFESNTHVKGNLLLNVQNGIRLVTKANHTLVKGNNISWLPGRNGSTAVDVQGCFRDTVTGNVILSLPQNNPVKGINVELSPASYINNNSLTRAYQGLYCRGMENPTELECNLMTNCFRGVVLDATDIGDQGSLTTPSDNRWIDQGGFTPQAGIFEILLPPTTLHTWFVRGGITYDPSPVNISNAMVDNTATGPNTCSPPCTGLFCLQQRLAQRVLASQTGPLEQENRFFGSDFAFRELKGNPVLMNLGTAEDAVLQTFYDSVQTTNIAVLLEVHELAGNGNTSLALAKNSGIVPACLIEQNQKTVNAIYLSSRAAGAIPGPQQLTELYSIASQCPLTGGRAVYQARTLLELATDSMVPYENDCPAGSFKRSLAAALTEKVNTTESNNIGRLYPNPNNGSMQLDYTITMDDKALLIVMDITGRELFKELLPPDQNQKQLNFKNINNGIYYYRIILNNSIVSAGKIAVLK